MSLSRPLRERLLDPLRKIIVGRGRLSGGVRKRLRQVIDRLTNALDGGVIRGVEGENLYYALPERTAVISPFFNGVRAQDPAVHSSAHLRDRPLVNTGYYLVINQRDEPVNQDIDLNSLSDIRLYVYYSADF